MTGKPLVADQPLVSFMIAGNQKCGTTALASFLDQHPALCMANPKEPHVFDSPDYSPAWTTAQINKRYEPYFEHCRGPAMKGEATPIYTLFPQITEALHRYNSALRLIILLRNPVERAISHHYMELGRGNETLPLWRALLMEPLRLRNTQDPLAANSAMRRHSYRFRGLYSRQLARLHQTFKPEQILVLQNDDLRNNHQATLLRVFRFLEVDDQIKIPQQTIFAGSQQTTSSVVRTLLSLSYTFERRRLRRFLASARSSASAPGQCTR